MHTSSETLHVRGSETRRTSSRGEDQIQLAEEFLQLWPTYCSITLMVLSVWNKPLQILFSSKRFCNGAIAI
ncbi:hypothetical protein ILYODFUR_003292 [Ilyodon furcidens]|uniref:Uncharacterized protein n=1 Tax=Ilyodon furcidens TaxID=33524 RepID=A0ABV0TH15_9TELE